jgi:hypothetical protein
MTDNNQEVANPRRAGCAERCTSGSEGGVRKRTAKQRALLLPYTEADAKKAGYREAKR